ncbi:MAG: Uma2 family endonuclease [Armatimonadaceae bacterium]
MSIAAHNVRDVSSAAAAPRYLTYAEYLAFPEETARYDILDGWKQYRLYGEPPLPNPTREHQEILLNLAEAFRRYQRSTQNGKTIVAPCDVEIQRVPLRTRQPDLLYISTATLEANLPADNPAPLNPAPELVVEILSPSDTETVLESKLADYARAGVRECWLVRSETQTVAILQRTDARFEPVGQFSLGETAASLVFDGLTVAVQDIFAL